MRTTTMNTVMMNNVQTVLKDTAEEIKATKRGLKAKAAAAVKFLFEGKNESPFDLSPAMEARMFL